MNKNILKKKDAGKVTEKVEGKVTEKQRGNHEAPVNDARTEKDKGTRPANSKTNETRKLTRPTNAERKQDHPHPLTPIPPTPPFKIEQN